MKFKTFKHEFGVGVDRTHTHTGCGEVVKRWYYIAS